MTMYTLYDREGRLFAQVQATPPFTSRKDPRLLAQISANDAAGAVRGPVDWDLHYVANGRIRKRPENPTQAAGNRLTELPTPCVISINGVEYPCDESEAELEFEQPGAYRVVVRAWPYLDKEFRFENPSP